MNNHGGGFGCLVMFWAICEGAFLMALRREPGSALFSLVASVLFVAAVMLVYASANHETREERESAEIINCTWGLEHRLAILDYVAEHDGKLWRWKTGWNRERLNNEYCLIKNDAFALWRRRL